MKKNQKQLERKQVYTIEQVMVHQVNRNPRKKVRVDFDGDKVRVDSDRLRVFKEKGFKCCECGIEGVFFAKERTKGTTDSYHFNLYGYDENGNDMLLTKDHIVPKSKGGRDHIDNYQTMCIRCNIKKGNEYEETSECKTS